jgi:two-component system, response regulator YesN
MYNLLIVDDEKNIRLGIEAMISREFSGEFAIETASDGMEALEKIKGKSFDLLITDIKMPRMDGIQLIQQIQQLGTKEPALIILSGYDDFEYTKAAIKSKVKDYLLKPVNRSELFQTVRNVLEEFKLKTDHDFQHLEDYRISQLNYILLNPNINEQAVEKICENIQLPHYPNGFYLGVVDHRKKLDGEDLLLRISHYLEPEAGKEKAVLFLDKDDRVVVISQVNRFLQMKESLSKEKYLTFSIGVSTHKGTLGQLKDAYDEASQALKYHFLYPTRKIIFYENIDARNRNDDIPVEMIKKIANMLGTEREKELKSNLLKVMDYEKISENHISYMEGLSKEINLVFESFFSKLGDEPVETFKLFNKVADIYNFESFYEYYQTLEELLLRLHEYNKQLRSIYSEQKYMDKAISYINDNYHKDLNLAVVSNHISLNYSYFSHMFKEYTGQNFVDYLKKVRIDEAKKLLTQPEFKVLEISEMVGYKNPKQFARVFREIEGVSPTEYREQGL